MRTGWATAVRADDILFNHQRMLINSLWRPAKGDLNPMLFLLLRITPDGKIFEETWSVTCMFHDAGGAELKWELQKD